MSLFIWSILGKNIGLAGGSNQRPPVLKSHALPIGLRQIKVWTERKEDLCTERVRKENDNADNHLPFIARRRQRDIVIVTFSIRPFEFSSVRLFFRSIIFFQSTGRNAI